VGTLPLDHGGRFISYILCVYSVSAIVMLLTFLLMCWFILLLCRSGNLLLATGECSHSWCFCVVGSVFTYGAGRVRWYLVFTSCSTLNIGLCVCPYLWHSYASYFCWSCICGIFPMCLSVFPFLCILIMSAVFVMVPFMSCV
jgi:hypothetical protein